MCSPNCRCNKCIVPGPLCVGKGSDVKYNGPYLNNIQVIAGQDLNTILYQIDQKILAGGLGQVTTTDTPTLEFDGQGTSFSPLTANAVISPNTGNLLVNSSGLYVSAINAIVQTDDTPTVSLSGVGNISSPLLATAVISTDPANILINNGGLFVPQGSIPDASFTNSYFDI